MRRLAKTSLMGALAVLFAVQPGQAQFTRVSVGLNVGLWDGVGLGLYGSSWDGPWGGGSLFSAGLDFGFVETHGIYTDFGHGWTHPTRSWGLTQPWYGSGCYADFWDPFYDPWWPYPYYYPRHRYYYW